MPAIGTIVVQTWNGRLIVPQRATRLANNFATDGTALVVGGWRSVPSTIVTINTKTADGISDLTSAAIAGGLSNTMLATIGTSLTVLNQFNQALAGVIVVSCTTSLHGLPNGNFLVEATWSLLPAAIPSGVVP
jgi:hypothetical protein